MAYSHTLVDTSFRKFCKRNNLNYYSGFVCVRIRQFPFSMFSYRCRDSYWTIQKIPWGDIIPEFYAQSFEEALAKCVYHNIISIQTLYKNLPWTEVMRILLSSQLTGTTNFFVTYLQQFGCHLPHTLKAKLIQLSCEESISVKREFYQSLQSHSTRLSHIL